MSLTKITMHNRDNRDVPQHRTGRNTEIQQARHKDKNSGPEDATPCVLISRVGLEPGTDYQASRKALLNQMLKPFAILPFNIIQQQFYSIRQNRTDVEANVEAVCSGLNSFKWRNITFSYD